MPPFALALSRYAQVTFDFFPMQSIKFTDAPFHESFVLPGTTAQVEDLLDDAWMHKNVALLEPDPAGSWAISVYKIEEKSPCVGEPEGTCVHYHGWARGRESNALRVLSPRRGPSSRRLRTPSAGERRDGRFPALWPLRREFSMPAVRRSPAFIRD